MPCSRALKSNKFSVSALTFLGRSGTRSSDFLVGHETGPFGVVSGLMEGAVKQS